MNMQKLFQSVETKSVYLNIFDQRRRNNFSSLKTISSASKTIPRFRRHIHPCPPLSRFSDRRGRRENSLHSPLCCLKFPAAVTLLSIWCPGHFVHVPVTGAAPECLSGGGIYLEERPLDILTCITLRGTLVCRGRPIGSHPGSSRTREEEGWKGWHDLGQFPQPSLVSASSCTDGQGRTIP